MYTIGGGRILESSDEKLKPFKDEVLMRLVEKEASISDRFGSLEFALKEMGRMAVDLKEFSKAAKAPADQVEAAVAQFEAAGKLVRFDGGRFMHADAVEATMQFLRNQVETYHKRNPLRAGFDLLVLRNESKLEEALYRRSLDELVRRGVLAVENGKARLSEFAVKLSREDAEAAAEVEKALKASKFATPRLEELRAKFPKYNAERVDRVLGLLVEQGTVVKLKDEVLFHWDTVEEAKRIVAEAIRARGPIEAAQVRDLTGTTRKYVIPLLEHLDDVGFTRRVENRRVLAGK